MSTSGGTTGTGTISDITSTLLTVTNPTGPTTDIEPNLTSHSSFIANDTAVANTATNLASLALAAGTWIIGGQGSFTNADVSASPEVDMWIGPTTTAITGAYASGGTVPGESATPFTAVNVALSVSAVVVLASPTTVFLEAIAGVNAEITAKKLAPLASAPNATGIWAVRIV